MADDSKLRAHRAETSDAGIATAERPTQDPLAELARLIGQDDLFEQMRRDAARAGKDAPPPSFESEDTTTVIDAPPPVQSAHTELRGSYDPAPRTSTAGEVYGEPAYAEPAYAEPAYTEAVHREPSYVEPAYAEPAYPDLEPTHTAAPRRYVEPARQTSARYQDAPDAGYQAAYAAQPGHADPYYADGPADPQTAAGAYDPAQDYDDPAYAEEPPPAPRRRSGFKTIAAILGLAVVGTAGAYGYRSMVGSGSTGQPPVIAGPNAPLKVAAAGSGKEQGSRTTYDRADRSQPERMVPREEQPLDPPRAASTRAPLTTGSTPGMPGIPNQQMAALPTPAGAVMAPGPTEPKKVKTMTIRPDGTVAAESATARSANAGGAGARVPARTPAQSPAAAAPAADPLRAANNPTPVRTASIPTATATAGAHVVQVASQKTEEDAQASFKSLQAKYPNVLSGRQPLIRKIDLGERGTFYRVQVGPFASADAANGLCDKLKEAGGQCIVQRN